MACLGLNGVGVSRGVAVGRAYVLQRDQSAVAEYCIPPGLVDQEVQRFDAAIDAARDELKATRDKIPVATPVDIVSFIDTHLLMLEDKALISNPVALIRSKRCNAEWALKIQRDSLVQVFESMDDPYLRTRRDDVDHVVNLILRLLGHRPDRVKTASKSGFEGCVIIADDLAPADTITLQHEGIAGFVTEYGGSTSHTAILARSLGIPAVVGVRNAVGLLRHDETVVVDGDNGVVVVNPDERGRAHYVRQSERARRKQQAFESGQEHPSVSRDGIAVALCANIELPEDLPEMKRVAAKGVGLYRTEYLFMNRDAPPDEEEQYAAYLNVVRNLNGAPLTIRTLDLGADKIPSFVGRQAFRGRASVNPALGLRAIRLCLRDPGLFLPQLRAILRVGAEGPVKMMIPMLTRLQEIRQTMALIDQAKQSLTREGVVFDNNMAVGGMIEVPAAALSVDAFARYLDFLSIGTNDLIQYTLAADRLDAELNHLCQSLHPAVLKLIHMIIEAGVHADIPVAMCGEMAGEPRYTRLLLALGLREFSMHPQAVPEIKHIIQGTDVQALARNVDQVLAMACCEEVENYIDRINAD